MRIPLALTIAVAATLTVATVSASAGQRRSRGPNRATRLENQFRVPTEYTGVLGGEIVVDGSVYRFATDATLYEIGNGLLDPGTYVTGRTICLTGARVNGVNVVRGVTVRPPQDVTRIGDDPATHVRVKDAAEPR